MGSNPTFGTSSKPQGGKLRTARHFKSPPHSGRHERSRWRYSLADVILFHHVLGKTEGIAAFAEELTGAGHTVHVPDLFEGRTLAASMPA